MTARVLLSTLGAHLDNHVVLPAVGTRGGVLIAWTSEACRALTTRVDTYSVSVLFENGNGTQWWFTGGSQRDEHKVLFLQELRTLRAACAGPSVVAGDFNLI